MKYAVLVYETAEEFGERTGPEAQAYWGAYAAYSDALTQAGAAAGGACLKGPETATTLRGAGDAQRVHDGPFADSREQLGGFFLIEADSLDAALAWASKCPSAQRGAVEVRPVQGMEEIMPKAAE